MWRASLGGIITIIYYNNIMAAQKKLMRSSKDKVIAGVCGGLGEYFGVDPLVVRILFIAAFIFMGSTFWIYLILWLIMPVDSKSEVGNADVVAQNVEDMKNKANEVIKGVEKSVKSDSKKK